MKFDLSSIKVNVSKVISLKRLSDSAFILRFEKGDFSFESGQYITLGFPGKLQKREYSVYSSPKDDFMEVLIKEVDHGNVSVLLGKLKEGDAVQVGGPYGHFTLNEQAKQKKHLFISSGTGISPCHSMIKTHSGLNYTVLHGIRNKTEEYEREEYSSGVYVSCTSRDNSGDFAGRVTDYLRKNTIDKESQCYICGNSNMIYEVFDILKEKGIPQEQINTEVYF